MVESFIYILAVGLALSYPLGNEPLFFLEPGRRATSLAGIEIPTAILFAGLIVVLYGIWSAAFYTYGLDENDSASLRRLSRRRWINRILALVLNVVILYVFHLRLEVEVPFSLTLTVALCLLPFFVMIAFNTFFSALREVILKAHDSLGSPLLFNFKAFVGFALVPMFAMLIPLDLLNQFEGIEKFILLHPISLYFVTVGLMLAFMALVPYLLKFVFGAFSLPADGFRRDLEALARKAEFTYSDLLILPTSGSRLGNAFIVGLLGPMRFVFFTDYLLAALSPEEVQCVMAHEIGHAKRHHLPAFFFLSVTSIVFAAVFHDYLSEIRSFVAPLAFPIMMFVWLGVLGFASRRFESEADLYGAKLYGNFETFSRALLTVSYINGMPPQIGGFRHFSIEKRVKMVLAAQRQPLFGEVLELVAKTIRRYCFWFFISAVSILITQLYRESREVPLRERDYDAFKLVEQGRETLFERYDYERAERELVKAIELNSKDPRGYLYLAYAQLGIAHFDEADRNLRKASDLGLVDPLDRLLARNMERTLSHRP